MESHWSTHEKYFLIDYNKYFRPQTNHNILRQKQEILNFDNILTVFSLFHYIFQKQSILIKWKNLLGASCDYFWDAK
jgi:hypothetical protein